MAKWLILDTPPGIKRAGDVQRWEERVEQAETLDAAQTQLIYQALLQLRMIKLILLWTLLILPAAGAILLVIMIK